MPKQYTFKTTRVTEWMEEVLDSLPPSERSRFIREAISDKIKGNNKVIQSNTLSYNETPIGNTLYDFDEVSDIEVEESIKIIEKNDSINLDDKLDDISKMFD